MFRILDLTNGCYISRNLSFNEFEPGDIQLFKTREAAEWKLDHPSLLWKYQRRHKAQFVIEEIPDV